MKILYGVQGTGNGHITRARILNNAFKQHSDLEVDFLFSGRKTQEYFDMDEFGQYQTCKGLSFVTKGGSVSRLKTLKNLDLLQFVKDVKAQSLSKYDLLINDFEPVTAWAAKLQKIPSLSISHQAAYAMPVPTEGCDLIDKLITRYFAPTTHSIGVHWYHYGQSIMPPFVESGLNNAPLRSKAANYTLVYLPFEALEDISNVLSPLSETSFICYHPDVSSAYTLKNIEWRPLSKQGFQTALVNSQNVIANGGFELATECISLGKAILIKPLKGQFEQLSNARTLRELGVSQTLYQLDTDLIEEWLAHASGQQIKFSSNPHLFIDWLKAGNWANTDQICKRLWQQVIFPSKVQHKLPV